MYIRIKRFVFLQTNTAMFDPEMKGLAIGNLPELAAAHNRHARPETNRWFEALSDRSRSHVKHGNLARYS